ncbi:MAG: pyruvate kinase [Thermoleophilaceae bacterium]|jgi:pyruvate kinase|nr:pyruvate kinase [Thermoleophilaceae bacterium]
MRSTKIVATIGPSSREPDVLTAMIVAGMDVARLNFAHGTREEHAETAGRIREAAERAGREVAILGDLPGPKLRLGPVAGGVAELGRGTRVVLTPADVEGTSDRLPVAWHGFAELVDAGDVCYLADGAVRLRVDEISDDDVITKVEVGGSVASRQGLNLPNVTVSLPAVSAEDISLIDAGLEMELDFFALSFVRRREDLDPVREHLAERGVEVPLIAKIEKPQAAANGEEIVDAADGIMIARGDLGIELPIEEVPLVQKRLLAVAGRRAKPTITATQMLESMVHSTRPTRAEVADVANAIFDGTDAVMLSQETAVGRHPVLAVEMMASIARTVERELPYGRWLAERGPQANNQYHAIAFGAVGAVYQLGLKCIVSPTNTGTTVTLISAYRPKAPVLALSPHRNVVRRCQLLWGVHPRLNEEPLNTLDLIDACADAAREVGLARKGDTIGITAGLPAGTPGGTNLFKVHTIE